MRILTRLASVPALCGSALLGAALLTAPVAAQSEPITDCPLRDAPFSAQLPMIDILLNDDAKAALEQVFDLQFPTGAGEFTSTTPPSFAAILTVSEMAGFLRKDRALVAVADAALRQIEVTDADRIARCARYDNDVPQFALSGDAPRIMLFEKINGFRDVPSVDAAHAALVAIAEREGWQMVATQSGGAFNADTLAQFDAVIWNNISGDVLTLSQRQAMRDYIEGGGGFVAVHGSAGDPAYFWDWYVDTLIGARFAGHPRDPQFQEARIVLDDPDHPAAVSMPAEWTMRDEWYTFRTNPRDSGSRIILTLDESSYQPSAGSPVDISMGGDHPIAWSRIIGKGRMFYSAIGHLPETYSHPIYEAMLGDAIGWAARLEDCECTDEE